MKNDYQCPKCGDNDQLDVYAVLQIRLTDDGSDVDLSADGSHEWDGESVMDCNACGHSGNAEDFEKPEPITAPPTVTANDETSWLEAIWHVLQMAREDCIPEGTPEYDQQWDEAATAMAYIREELGLPDEVETEV